MKSSRMLMVALGLLAWTCLQSVAQVTIDPPTRTFAKEGGGGSVLTSGSGSWTATKNVSWITITPRTNGVAGESCIYVVDANFSADTRQGIVTINGLQHTVTQTGYSATLSPSSASHDFHGGAGSINITTEAGVSWSASSSASWVSVTPSSGIGSGSVSYSVDYYGGVTTRSTSLTIAGRTFSVTQTGTDVNIDPWSVERAYSSTIIQVQVTALVSTTWSVTPNATWISVVDAGNGFGDSTITLAIGTNPSYLTRTGTVTIGSATFTIVQEGSPNPVLDIIPLEATANPLGAFGNVAVLATPDGPWHAESLASWINISSGETGAGNGNIQYVVSANPNLTPRIGQIRIHPPVYQARSDLSWLLFAHIRNSSQDVSGWSRHLSGSLAQTFNGTNPLTMTGQDFYRNDDAFSIAFWFKVDEIDAINRLLEVTRAASSYSTIYVNALNRLVFLSNGQSLVTDLSVKAGTWYQVLVAADASRNVSIYGGERISTIANVGNLQFSSAPFPRNYVTTARIRLGASVQPSSGNLNNGRIDDLRIYGRALSAYESTKLQQYAGTATPYGPFSHKGDAGNVRVEYNLQGQSVVAGGSYPPSSFTSSLVPFDSRSVASPVSLRYTLTLSGQNVSEIQGIGASYNSSLAIIWYYKFLYIDGSEAQTPTRVRYSSVGQAYTEANPYPERLVSQILVFAGHESTLSGSLTSSVKMGNELNPMLNWTPHEDRFALHKRSIGSTGNGRIHLRNHQSSFSSAHATYNFWLRFDSFPSSEGMPIFGRSVNGVQSPAFACWLLPSGRLRFSRDATVRDYNANLQAGQWHMITIAGTQNGFARFFVDGEEIGNTADFGDYVYGMSGTTRHSLGIGGWNGAIDYAGFYDGALSSAQIRDIYNAQKPQIVYHTVTQGVVTPAIAPASATVGAGGGSVETALTLAQNVNWTASTSTSWLQITSPTNGAGAATIAVLASANPTVYSRTGTVTIAGQTFTVVQAGLNATVVAPDVIFGTDGGSSWVDILAEGGGQWQSISQVPWLTVALGASGAGSGSSFIVADPYTDTSSSRIGAVLIAGQMIYFTQRGYSLSVSPQVAQIGSNAGAGEFGVAAPLSAVWEAIVTQPWITLMGGTTGIGNGTVRYSVAANTTGASRTGRIIVSGTEYTITQLSSLQLVVQSAGNGTVSGSGSYEVNATAQIVATPSSGYLFSHWTGDAVGSQNPLSLNMDSSKNIAAYFIPQDAGVAIANSMDMYTTDQMHELALSGIVLDRNPSTGKMSVSIQMQQTPDLASGWTNVVVDQADVFIDAGKIRVDITPQGNAAFYRLSSGGE